MSSLLRRAAQFLGEDEGPTTTEYAVLLALIAIAALITMATFGERINSIYTAIAQSVGAL